MYGVSMHEVLGKDLNIYKLGLTPFGMLIYDGEERIGLFLWQKMTRLYFNKKQLFIHVADSDPNGDEKLHVFQFTLKSSKVCKHLWKCAIEFHMFYRLQSSNVPELRDRQSFVRMQSKFRYSGRTEAQLRASAKAPQPRRQIQFQRRPSKRYSRRESHRVRERILSQSQNNVDSLNSSHNTNANFPMGPRKGRSGSQVSLNSRPSNINHQYNVSSNAINYSGKLDQKRSMTDLELSGHRGAAGYDRSDNLIEFSPSSNESKSLGYASYIGSSIAMNKQSSHGSRIEVDEERGCVEFVRTQPKVPERPMKGHYLLSNNESMVSSSNSSGTPQKSSSDGEKSVHNPRMASRNNNYYDQHFDSHNQPVVPPPRGKSSMKYRDSSRDRSSTKVARDEYVSSNDHRDQRSQDFRPTVLPMDQNESNASTSFGGNSDASARYNHHKNLLFDNWDREGPSFLSSTLISPEDEPHSGTKDNQFRQLPSYTSSKVSRRVMMTEI